MNKISPIQPIWVMLLVVIGIMAAAGIFGTQFNDSMPQIDSIQIVKDGEIMEVLYPPATEESAISVGNGESGSFQQKDLFFNYYTKFLVWMFFFCLLIGASFGFTLPLCAEFLWIKQRVQGNSALILKSIVGAIAVIAIAFGIAGGGWMSAMSGGGAEHYKSFAAIMGDLGVFLHHPKYTMMALMILGSIGPMLAIAGILLVNFSMSGLDRFTDPKVISERFQKLSKSLNFFLFALALMISLTTVTTALGRDALVEVVPWAADLLLPIDFVYLYGLIFTAILAIIYIPVFFQLKRKGESILKLIDNPAVPLEEDADSPEIDEEVRDILMLKPTSLDNLKVSLSILGPVLTGLLSKFIEI